MNWPNLFAKETVDLLKTEIVELEKALFESQQLERIASTKLTTWVAKHDELLITHKKLAARFKRFHPYAKI